MTVFLVWFVELVLASWLCLQIMVWDEKMFVPLPMRAAALIGVMAAMGLGIWGMVISAPTAMSNLSVLLALPPGDIATLVVGVALPFTAACLFWGTAGYVRNLTLENDWLCVGTLSAAFVLAILLTMVGVVLVTDVLKGAV